MIVLGKDVIEKFIRRYPAYKGILKAWLYEAEMERWNDIYSLSKQFQQVEIVNCNDTLIKFFLLGGEIEIQGWSHQETLTVENVEIT